MIRRAAAVAALIATVGIVVSLPARGAPSRAATDVDLPASIDASGKSDVTVALNAFFATLAPGSTVRFPKGGTFLAEGIVFVTGRQNVTMEGRGSRLVARTDGAAFEPPNYRFRNKWPRLRNHLNIQDSTGITVRDLAIVGPNSSGEYRIPLEAQAGIAVRRSVDVTLDHVTVRETFGDGVYIVGRSRNVRIQDCRLERIGRQGVAVVGGEKVVVERCEISGVGRSAIDLEPAGGLATDVRIRDNRVRDVTNFLLAAVGAGAQVGDVWLERNQVEGGRGVSVYVGVKRTLRSGIHVIDNVGTGRSGGYEGALMRFERFDGIEVRGNRQRVERGVVPVRLINSCNERVTGNDFDETVNVTESEGRCDAPGLRSSTSNPRPTVGVGGDQAASPRNQQTTSQQARQEQRRVERQLRQLQQQASTLPSNRAVATVTDAGGTSPVTIALAFGAGVLVGAGVMFLRSWSRRSVDTVSE